MAIIDKKQKRWYAESTFESLDKTTIPIGTEIQVSGKLGQGDFDDDTNTKLNAINGKLNAPTDEITADSVPVISSTGTVSAQPFKKYYKHKIHIMDYGDGGLITQPFKKYYKHYINIEGSSSDSSFWCLIIFTDSVSEYDFSSLNSIGLMDIYSPSMYKHPLIGSLVFFPNTHVTGIVSSWAPNFNGDGSTMIEFNLSDGSIVSHTLNSTVSTMLDTAIKL